MSYLKIERTEDTPEVIFDSSSGNLLISGISFPDNIERFYTPILMWLEEYIANPQPKTEMVFKFEYFNTSSSKKIYDIILYLEKILDIGKEVKIKWMYAEDDDDIRSAGQRFSLMTQIPIEIEKY